MSEQLPSGRESEDRPNEILNDDFDFEAWDQEVDLPKRPLVEYIRSLDEKAASDESTRQAVVNDLWERWRNSGASAEFIAFFPSLTTKLQVVKSNGSNEEIYEDFTLGNQIEEPEVSIFEFTGELRLSNYEDKILLGVRSPIIEEKILDSLREKMNRGTVDWEQCSLAKMYVAAKDFDVINFLREENSYIEQDVSRTMPELKQRIDELCSDPTIGRGARFFARASQELAWEIGPHVTSESRRNLDEYFEAAFTTPNMGEEFMLGLFADGNQRILVPQSDAETHLISFVSCSDIYDVCKLKHGKVVFLPEQDGRGEYSRDGQSAAALTRVAPYLAGVVYDIEKREDLGVVCVPFSAIREFKDCRKLEAKQARKMTKKQQKRAFTEDFGVE